MKLGFSVISVFFSPFFQPIFSSQLFFSSLTASGLQCYQKLHELEKLSAINIPQVTEHPSRMFCYSNNPSVKDDTRECKRPNDVRLLLLFFYLMVPFFSMDIFYFFCGRLTLAGCQVLTELLHHSPSLCNKGEKMRWKKREKEVYSLIPSSQ